MIKELVPRAQFVLERGRERDGLEAVERITLPDRYNCGYWLAIYVKGNIPYHLGCLVAHQVNAQETADQVFHDQLPGTFHQVRKVEEDFPARWRKAAIIGSQINELLSELSINGVIDWRAKSLYSIYKKTRRFPINQDEIFDKIGVRVIVPIDTDVETIKNTILARPMVFRLMQEYRFKRLDKTHPPIRVVERDDGYKALHMNIFARNVDGSEELFELQLMTKSTFNRLYPDTVPQAREMYKLKEQFN